MTPERIREIAEGNEMIEQAIRSALREQGEEHERIIRDMQCLCALNSTRETALGDALTAIRAKVGEL